MADTVTIVGSLAHLDLTAYRDAKIRIDVYSAPSGSAIETSAAPGVTAPAEYVPTAYVGSRVVVTDDQGLWGAELPWQDGAVLRVSVPGDVTRYLMMGTGAGEHPAGSTVNVRLLPGPDEVVTPSVALDALVGDAVEDYLTAHPPTGGVTDHGALTGLGDDDHLIYLTNARGDARYVQPGSLAPVATAGDYASLTGTVPTSALPPLAINTVTVVATQAAMLALTAERGDIAVRSDVSKTFILADDDPTVLANWVEVLTPGGGVTSVAGKTGVVFLVKADVGLGSVDNTSDIDKPVSTATASALAGKSDTGHTHSGLSAATDSTAGIVELATTAEATTGTDTVRAVTPAGVAAAAASRLAAASNLSDVANAATARANLGAAAAPLYSTSTADQTVTSSTTLVNATDLSVPVAANAVYEWSAHLRYNASPGGDIKLGITGPAGATAEWVADALTTGATGGVAAVSRTALNIGDTQGGAGVGIDTVARPAGRIVTAGTAGTLQIQFAQLAADGTGTVLRAGSYITARRVA